MLLRRRQRTIARTYFDAAHINPIDGFAVSPIDGFAAAGAKGRIRLRYRDLAVENAVVPPAAARYRVRAPDGTWTATTLRRATRRRAAGRARDRDQSRPGHALEPADAGHGRG